jgi:3',5'-cyclic AMP phosphodiesterase CpdA
MTVRIAQVSDAHLSASKPAFADNFGRIAEAIRAERFDILLATGDLNLLGEDSEEELAYGVAQHAAIGPEMLCVPGNHDVGNDPALGRNEATPERLERWQRQAGPTAWIRDLPGWRLVGLDCQSLAFHDPQWELIGRALTDLGSRSLALVQHMPLSAGALDDAENIYWTPAPAMRARLMAAFGARRPALVISGHVHQWRDRVADGMRQVWAPSTAFVLGDAWQPAYGTKVIGWVEHAFHPDGTHDARLRTVDGLALNDIGHMPQVYRPMPTLAERPDLWKKHP